MKVLRINLHIRQDVSPQLYEALATMPARPRAELLRRLAELGLRLQQRGRLPSTEAQAAAGDRAFNVLTQKDSPADLDAFGDQLVSVVGDSF